MTQLAINLTDELRDLVEKSVDSGVFHNASAVSGSDAQGVPAVAAILPEPPGVA